MGKQSEILPVEDAAEAAETTGAAQTTDALPTEDIAAEKCEACETGSAEEPAKMASPDARDPNSIPTNELSGELASERVQFLRDAIRSMIMELEKSQAHQPVSRTGIALGIGTSAIEGSKAW